MTPSSNGCTPMFLRDAPAKMGENFASPSIISLRMALLMEAVGTSFSNSRNSSMTASSCSDKVSMRARRALFISARRVGFSLPMASSLTTDIVPVLENFIPTRLMMSMTPTNSSLFHHGIWQMRGYVLSREATSRQDLLNEAPSRSSLLTKISLGIFDS